MRSNTLIAVLSCAALAAACGGDDSDGGSADNSDITVDDGDNTDDNDDTLPVDAPLVDAPNAPLTGLGQACSMQTPCPADFACLTYTAGATSGLCTKVCVDNGSFTTDANAQPQNLMPPNFNVGDATCSAAYSGTVGTPACVSVANLMPAQPAGGGFAPNTAYTFLVACSIVCDANNACPGDLTCNVAQDPQAPSICEP